MFGDYFGQRADYSRGMFYSGHRRYLNPSGTSAIEPPLEFRSKRQLRQMKLSRARDSRNEEKISFQMNFQKKGQGQGDHGEGEGDGSMKKFRKVANIIRSTITVDHFSSVNKDDWIEELRAGVKLWVNKETGEVAAECPWDNQSNQTPIQRLLKQKSGRRQSLSTLRPEEVGMGTGSLVYDSSEVQELFKMLDPKAEK